MNKKLIIGGLIAGGVGLFAFSIYYYIKKQTELIKSFSYKITGLSLGTFTMEMINGKMNVLFTSISDVEVVVKEFYVDFYFNGEKVGYLQDVTEFIIPARGSAEIPFEFNISPVLILNDITDIVKYAIKEKDASLSVDGYATLKSGFLKATLPIKYDTTIKQILS